jgi:sugar phosphate isomerase/epimerase
MICMHGEREQTAYLQEIERLGSGIELGSYGLVGVRSQQEWEDRVSTHRAIAADFKGKVALHGPFVGMEFAHIDCLIRQAVQKRLDMMFDVATSLRAFRVVLHSGLSMETELFGLQDSWLKRSIEFWKAETPRWERSNTSIVLENDTQKSPDLLIQLVKEVASPVLGLCLDVGHLHVFSTVPPAVWIASMGKYLQHIHLHDNDREADRHWSIGKGSIDFAAAFQAVSRHAPDATLSLEVEDRMEVKMIDLRRLRRQLGVPRDKI